MTSKNWPTGFMLIQGNRLEALCGLMDAWMKEHPLHPLENEMMLVQSNGMAQWLKLALAANPGGALTGGCGIAAAIRTNLPGRFIWYLYRCVLGDLPDSSAFDKAPMTWRLYRLLGAMDALEARLSNPECLAPLRGFLEEDDDPRRRHQLAAQLADLYDQYQVYRADWLEAWEQGRDITIRPNGSTLNLPDTQRWQPALWRCLTADLGETGLRQDGASRAEIHRRFMEKTRAHSYSLHDRLPRRIIVFGISSLPRQSLEALEAISKHTQVMLFAHNPSRHYWGDIIEGRDLFRSAYRRHTARKVPEDIDDTALNQHGHPLLAAWGKQGRDYIRLLDEHDQRTDYEGHFRKANLDIDLFESPGNATLLQQLQDDILELRPLPERQALATVIDPLTDRSLAFLVAHSPQREVEILHDQLLDAFAQAATSAHPLRPRDVLVMVPDIHPYAPHIEAVFGRLAADDPRHIPFHLSDQGLRHRNPLLTGLERLLNLPQSRCAVSELLDLLDIPALRARFDLDESDLPRLRSWISGAKIRWGLHAAHRASLGLPDDLEQNTWRFGLRRMLLGFATGAAQPWQGIEPYDEIGGLEAALVGPLAQMLDMLEKYWNALQIARTPQDWAQRIARLLADAFTAVSEDDTLAIAQVLQALEHWQNNCQQGNASVEPLPLAVVRAALLAGLDEPTLNQHFLAGAVNFATLMPMRAIPFRQIWLLGMNDSDYPRSRRPPDFDLMANDYRPGDRSRREDDRYLFLEALLSARERLVISWIGRSIRDNAPRPSSVLVGQLRDHLAAGWRLAAHIAQPDGMTPGEALLAALTTEHPLQPFSRQYFEPHRNPRLFTYAHEWHAVHQDRESEPETAPRFAPPTLDAPIQLATLGRFLCHPVRMFYTQRLSLDLTRNEQAIEDEEVFHFDGLGSWGIRDAMIQTLASTLAQDVNIDAHACLHNAMARLARAGTLPLAPFDAVWMESLTNELEQPVADYQERLRAYPEPCPMQTVQLNHGGVSLEDSLSDLRQDADGNRVRLRLLASRLVTGKGEIRWAHLMRAWPFHLAAQFDGPVTTHLLGPHSHIILDPLPAATARERLEQLLDGYLEGLTALLPLACKTGFAQLQRNAGGKADPAVIYEGDDQSDGECATHPGYRRFWPTYAELAADQRFNDLIERLYQPLFDHYANSAERAA